MHVLIELNAMARDEKYHVTSDSPVDAVQMRASAVSYQKSSRGHDGRADWFNPLVEAMVHRRQPLLPSQMMLWRG